jgi:hypothetical protein
MSLSKKKKSCFSGHATGWILDLADDVLIFFFFLELVGENDASFTSLNLKKIKGSRTSRNFMGLAYQAQQRLA